MSFLQSLVRCPFVRTGRHIGLLRITVQESRCFVFGENTDHEHTDHQAKGYGEGRQLDEKRTGAGAKDRFS